MHNCNWQLLQFLVSVVVFFFCLLCFIKVKLSVKVKLFVLLLCVRAILPAKAVPEMIYTVSGGTLNPTHSLTHLLSLLCDWLDLCFAASIELLLLLLLTYSELGVH